MRRRNLLRTLAVGSAAAAGAAVPDRARALPSAAMSGRIETVSFDSAASLLDASKNPKTDGALVYAGENATNTDSDGNGDRVAYGDDERIAMVVEDGSVVGFGGMFVNDGRSFQYGNEEFYLNLWDDLVGGGTVLWDESHGQFYSLSKFSGFESYAESNGYTVEATSSLSADLGRADAVVVTSPADAFSSSELNSLSNFVDGGGVVFLHDQSDFRDYDNTGNLNDVADALGVSFRFNDDQVVDPVQNAGADYRPVTGRFGSGADPYLEGRDGMGLDPSKTYTVDVTSVTDGDTVDVEFSDGRTESVRVLGVDTPEKPSNSRYEREQEWEGIESLSTLGSWGTDATKFGKDRLSGKTVEVFFDEEEGIRDPFGRLLGYVRYDGGKLYNRELIDTGHARCYGSGLSRHDEFRRVELRARANDRGIWAESDPANTPEIRNRPVDDLFFPTAASVKTEWGAVSDYRVPVYAASTAKQDIDDDGSDSPWWWFGGDVEYDDVPLVAVDEYARAAMVGAPIVSEDYEKAEDYAVDTSNYENFVFLTNLINGLAEDGRDGPVLIDGGHGQFSAGYALSGEDAAYYRQFLEGVGIGFEQVNDLTDPPVPLGEARAVIVTAPAEGFDRDEAAALRRFARDGGAVVLMGASTAVEEARENLNEVADAVGTDLRLNDDEITDPTNNVNGDPSVLTTGRFDTDFDLYDPVDGGSGGGGGGGGSPGDVMKGDLRAGESATHTYDPASGNDVTVTLSAGENTDFDLYVTYDGRPPTRSDYDERSWGYGSDEVVTVEAGKITGEVGIMVYAYRGSGDYTVAVTEG